MILGRRSLASALIGLSPAIELWGWIVSLSLSLFSPQNYSGSFRDGGRSCPVIVSSFRRFLLLRDVTRIPLQFVGRQGRRR